MVPTEGRLNIVKHNSSSPKAPKQNFGFQPQTLEGEEGGGGGSRGGHPPPPTVYGHSNTSLLLAHVAPVHGQKDIDER